MKKNTTFFALIILATLLANTNEIQAQPYMGVDLTYACVSDNQYLVTLRIIRDCNSMSLSDQQTLHYTSSTCGVSATQALTLVSEEPPFIVNPKDVTPLCQGQLSACGEGDGLYGVEQWFYQGTITLPPGCGNDWVLSWTACCRSALNTTLVEPSTQNFYTEATLDNTLADCNTSAQFRTLPMFFACVNEFVYYTPRAVNEVDEDLIVYSLVDGLSAANESVEHTVPYTGSMPLNPTTGAGAAVIDPTTGNIQWTPDILQIGTFCVLAEEFRDANGNGIAEPDEKIAEVRQDVQVIVMDCYNTSPSDEGGIDGTGTFTKTVSVGESFCFDITGNDNPGTLLTLTWDERIAGATFESPTGNYPVISAAPTTGTFCWTPTAADVGSHSFNVLTIDNGCPVRGQNISVYTIVVEP